MGRSVPFVAQNEPADCGAACLAMVLAYHGRHVSVGELTKVAGASRDGFTALALIELGRHFGLEGRGYSVKLEALHLLPTATVLHCGESHFVVLEKVSSKGLHIVDPSVGRRIVPLQQTEDTNPATALTFNTTPSFARRRRQRPLYLQMLYRKLFRSPRFWLSVAAALGGQAVGLTIPVLFGGALNSVLTSAALPPDRTLAIGVIAGAACGWLLLSLRGVLAVKVKNQIDRGISSAFTNHLVRLPFAFFESRRASDIATRINSATRVREVVSQTAGSLTVDCSMVLLCAPILLAISKTLFLVVSCAAMARVLVYALASTILKTRSAEEVHALAEASSLQMQMIASIETIQAMGLEDQVLSRWDTLNDAACTKQESRGRARAIVEALNSALALLGYVLVVTIGSRVLLSGDISAGALVTFVAVASAFLVPIGGIMDAAMVIDSVDEHLSRIDDILSRQPRISAVRPARMPTASHVCLKDVTFGYSPRGPVVLDNISCEFLAGTMTAIVGPSGSGKSSLVKVAIGLLEPRAGRISVDGRVLDTTGAYSPSGTVGFVPQVPQIFPASIADNIGLGTRLRRQETIRQAARLAHIDTEIESMPMGYDTVIGAGSGGISGGQRQRIALARAFARKPTLLVLDEALGHLDAEMQERILASIRSLDCTVIAVSHQPLTVLSADTVIVLTNGRLERSGSHQTIASLGGWYGDTFGKA
ncbi:MAG TPA: peptidase domain-containing ABC transporter [Candidatus Krumholzibacteria bacterium]|nr:peptidase domain-containing ABC transporter [Candidatus Krumholzibacteria bacterium]